MSFSTDYKKLKDAEIEFRDESFHSTFWGNRIIIRSRKDAIKAEKILGTYATRYFKEWQFEYYS